MAKKNSTAPETPSLLTDMAAAGVSPPDDNTPEVPETPETQTTPETPVAETPEPTAPETPAADPTAQTPTETPSQYLERIKGLGFENVTNEQEAFDRLIESYQKEREQALRIQQAYQQAQPYVQYGQQYLQQLQNPAFQQFQAQAQQSKPEEPKQDPTKWWTPPEYDPVLIDKYRDVTIDPVTGERRIDWKPNTPADVRATVEAHQAYREKWAEELVSNPQKALSPFKNEVLHEVRQMFDELLGTNEQQREVNQFAEQIKASNPWMFEADPRTGQILVDPISGQPVWSQYGQLACRYIEKAGNVGIEDPQEQWNYALAMLQIQAGQQQQQPAQPQVQAPPAAPAIPPAQVAANKKQELLERGRGATSIPQRAGSIPPTDASPRKSRSQNAAATAGDKLREELRKMGQLAGTP